MELKYSNQENNELKKELKDCAKSWCENTTFHGFLNIIKTDSYILRLTWIIIVSLGFYYSTQSNFFYNCFYFNFIYRKLLFISA